MYNKIMSGYYDGGLAYGRMYEIYGPSGSGKTLVATNVIVEAQKAGGLGILIDFEHAFSKDLAVSIGMDPKRFINIEPETWEEGLQKAMQVTERMRDNKMIDPKAPIVVVVDSIASATPKSVLEKELTEHTMNDTTALARATSSTLKIVAARAKRANITWLFLNQIRLKPGVMFGDPTTTPGGGAMEFVATARLSLSRKQLTKQVSGTKQIIGSHITAKCVKSKLTRPFQTAAVDFLYHSDEQGGRFDLAGSLLEHLSELDIIKRSGNFYVWTDEKKYPKATLSDKIVNEGLMSELMALLPKSTLVKVPTD